MTSAERPEVCTSSLRMLGDFLAKQIEDSADYADEKKPEWICFKQNIACI